MKTLLSKILIGLLLLIGLVSLYLTNSGILSIGNSYVRRMSAGLKRSEKPVAFVNVNVIPMDSERTLIDQTVVVHGGLITAVGESSQVTVPAEAQIIDGQGKYLFPGLVDMHVHIEDENDLVLYAANGVTTVRNMWGNSEVKLFLRMPDQLQLREEIKKGVLFGPTIYTAGPLMEGQPATSPLMPVFTDPSKAAEAIAWQKAEGYDFIKVYDYLSAETYQAIIDAAKEGDIPVVGHVPFAVGLEDALAGGQTTIEHLTGYINPDAAEFLIPEDQLSVYAEMTREAGVWNCPTIGLYQNTLPPEKIDALEAQPGVEYMSPLMRTLMKFFIRQLSGLLKYEGDDYTERIGEMYIKMTSALHQAGAKVILCTDANNSYLVPGFSLLDELDYLVEAGFSPYEAIQAGTYNAAEAMGKLEQFGTVEAGKRADLVLVDGNPLENVNHMRNRSGVMLRGQWYTQTDLQTMLDELAASHYPSFLERIWPLALIALALFFIFRRKTKKL